MQISEMTVPQLVDELREAKSRRTMSAFLLVIGVAVVAAAAVVKVMPATAERLPAMFEPLVRALEPLPLAGLPAIGAAWAVVFGWRMFAGAARAGALAARLEQTRFEAKKAG